MSYGVSGKPHALASISGTPSLIPTDSLTVTYTDFRKIATLREGNKAYELTYGVDNQRRKSIFKVNGTTKLTRYYLGDYEEEITPDGNVRKIHYLSGGAILIRNNNVDTLLYAYGDNQGSLTALANEAGTVLERYAYDPWGRRLNPTDWRNADTRTAWRTNRGYTGHEHLDAFGIINMNGRVYDPATAMFLSPDPFVQEPGNWVNYNRYGYCFNNPTNGTDPSGYIAWSPTCFLTEAGEGMYTSINAFSVELGGGGGGGGMNGWYNYYTQNASRNLGEKSLEEVKDLYELSIEQRIQNPYARYVKVTEIYQVNLTYGNEKVPFSSSIYSRDAYYRLPDEDPTERDLADLRGDKFTEDNSKLIGNASRSAIDIIANIYEKFGGVKGGPKIVNLTTALLDFYKLQNNEINESDFYEDLGSIAISESVSYTLGWEVGLIYGISMWALPASFKVIMKPVSKYLNGVEQEIKNDIINGQLEY